MGEPVVFMKDYTPSMLGAKIKAGAGGVIAETFDDGLGFLGPRSKPVALTVQLTDGRTLPEVPIGYFER